MDEAPARSTCSGHPPHDADGDAIAADPDSAEPGVPAAQRAVIIIGCQSAQPVVEADDEGGSEKPLPDRLLSELTAYRTLALRDAVANNPHAAMTALLHKLCLDTFRKSGADSCLEVSVRPVSFAIQPTDLKDSLPARSIADRHEYWKAGLPKDDDALWNWLAELDDTSRGELLAHCVSAGVNALYERGDRHGAPGISVRGVDRRLAHADRLARAVGLDMAAAGWRPTADNYLSRVTKLRILDAVREAKGEHAARLIDHLKKGDMAKEAARLLDGTGWLPEPLRLAGSETGIDGGAADGAATDVAGCDADVLPDFLSEDGDPASDAEAEDPPLVAIAAE